MVSGPGFYRSLNLVRLWPYDDRATVITTVSLIGGDQWDTDGSGREEDA